MFLRTARKYLTDICTTWWKEVEKIIKNGKKTRTFGCL